MTAQIAVLNRVGIALASDSAVTIDLGGQRKIFTSANKLFRLSRYQPIGVMIYGNADLIGVPWEAIVKTYREKLGTRKLDTVAGYADDFLGFLNDVNSGLFSQSAQDRFITASIVSYFKYIVEAIEDKVRAIFDSRGFVTEGQVKRILSAQVEKHKRLWEEATVAESFPPDCGPTIVSRYRRQLDKAVRKVF